MKLATAISNAETMYARLCEVQGIIETPNTCRPAYKIKNLWVFGSTVKRSENPNDLDILFDGEHIGEFISKFNGCIPVYPLYAALRWLRRDMKMVRFHDLRIDGELAHPRVMLFPTNDFSKFMKPFSEKE